MRCILKFLGLFGGVILYGLLICLLNGCVSISYNPARGSFTYKRFGNQKIQDITCETPEGLKIHVGDVDNSELQAVNTAVSVAGNFVGLKT